MCWARMQPCCLGSCTRAAEIRIWPRTFFPGPRSSMNSYRCTDKPSHGATSLLAELMFHSSQIARSLPFIRTLINKTWNKPVYSLHLSASTKGKQLIVTVVSTPTKTSVYPRKQHHPLAVRCLASGKAVALVLQPGASPQLNGMAVTPVFCSPRAKSLFSARHRAHRDPSPNRAWQSFSTVWEFWGFLSLGMEFLYRWYFTGNH